MFLTESKLSSLIESCQQSANFNPLKQNLWDVFSSPDCLGISWLLSSTSTSTTSTTSTTSNTSTQLSGEYMTIS